MRTLRAATAGQATPGARGVVAAVLRWEDGGPPRVVVRRMRRGEAVPSAYRAVLLALWEARRMGARSLVLGCDDPEVIAQISGMASPPPDAVVPYLQIRALVNSFRLVRIERLAPSSDHDAALAAEEVVARLSPTRGLFSDLPLWAAAS
jgi:hypothetical protein